MKEKTMPDKILARWKQKLKEVQRQQSKLGRMHNQLIQKIQKRGNRKTQRLLSNW